MQSADQAPFIERYAQEGLRLAQETGDQKIRARSLVSLGLVHVERGALHDAIRTFEEAVQINRRERDNRSLASSLAYLCLVNYFQGKFRPVSWDSKSSEQFV